MDLVCNCYIPISGWRFPCVYFSQLIHFAGVCCNVRNFKNIRLLSYLKKGHRYHDLCKAFSKIYRGLSELVVKCSFGDSSAT